MELVPILSTIILVGTIATFILAVAAYVLYKIRERRARGAVRGVGRDGTIGLDAGDQLDCFIEVVEDSELIGD